MTKFPYKVTVKGKGNDVNVVVDPPPVASSPEHAEHVTKRVSDVIMANSNSMKANTFRTRAMLKAQLTSVLQQLHAQGMITPKKEKDEATS